LWLVGQPVLAAKIMQQIVERKYSRRPMHPLKETLSVTDSSCSR